MLSVLLEHKTSKQLGSELDVLSQVNFSSRSISEPNLYIPKENKRVLMSQAFKINDQDDGQRQEVLQIIRNCLQKHQEGDIVSILDYLKEQLIQKEEEGSSD